MSGSVTSQVEHLDVGRDHREQVSQVVFRLPPGGPLTPMTLGAGLRGSIYGHDRLRAASRKPVEKSAERETEGRPGLTLQHEGSRRMAGREALTPGGEQLVDRRPFPRQGLPPGSEGSAGFEVEERAPRAVHVDDVSVGLCDLDRVTG